MKRAILPIVMFVALSVMVMPVHATDTKSMSIYVRPLLSGSVQPSTSFDYIFNFTSDSGCSNVLLSESINITTDQYGLGYATIDTTGLNITAAFICEYRDGSLRKIHNLTPRLISGSLAEYTSNNPSVWARQSGTGWLMNLTGPSGDMFGVNGSGCIIFPDGSSQCSEVTDTNTDTWATNYTDYYNISDVDDSFLSKLGDTGTGDYNFMGDVFLYNMTVDDTIFIDKDTYAVGGAFNGYNFYQDAQSFGGLAGRMSFGSDATAFQEYYFYGPAGYSLSFTMGAIVGFVSVLPIGFTSTSGGISFSGPGGHKFSVTGDEMWIYNNYIQFNNGATDTYIIFNESGKTYFTGANNGWIYYNNVGIGNSTPLHPLTVYGGNGGIGVFVEQSISVESVITRTPKYDPDKPNKGFHNYSYYLNPDGSYNESRFYGYFKNNITKEIKDENGNVAGEEYIITEGVVLDDEIANLIQSGFELEKNFFDVFDIEDDEIYIDGNFTWKSWEEVEGKHPKFNCGVSAIGKIDCIPLEEED